MSPKLLDEKAVSEWLGISVPTLRTMRSRPGRDPIPFVKVGRLVRYRQELIQKWIERNTFDDTEQSNAG